MYRSRVLSAVLLSLVLVLLLEPTRGSDLVTLVEMPLSSDFPGATDPGVVQLACASETSDLKKFFFREALPFKSDLVRSIQGFRCHIYYRPTVVGFRATPEDYPIRALRFSIDSLQFLTPSAQGETDALDVIKSVLEKIRTSLDVEISFPFSHQAEIYQQSKRQHFPQTVHKISLDNQGREQISLRWAQDLFKPGLHKGKVKILVPRRLFQGEAKVAELYDGLIRDLTRRGNMTRSQLAWEGGDFQFTLDPRDASKTILYYGAAAKPYWGEALSPKEYEYVLRLEFGADRAVDLSGFVPHVDYLVAFLPRDHIVLVSEPLPGSRLWARVALDKLLAGFGRQPPLVLRELSDLLNEPFSEPNRALSLLERAWAESPGWHFPPDPAFWSRLNIFADSVCPDQRSCFDPGNQIVMLQQDPDLLGLWVRKANEARSQPKKLRAYLSLIQTAFTQIPEEESERLEQKVQELEALGFRVVRVPRPGAGFGKKSWPGISYVNGLVINQQVFIPEFGLGRCEQEIFSQLREQLPNHYRVIPVPAEKVLIRNGGIHCLTAIIRGSKDSSPRYIAQNR